MLPRQLSPDLGKYEILLPLCERAGDSARVGWSNLASKTMEYIPSEFLDGSPAF